MGILNHSPQTIETTEPMNPTTLPPINWQSETLAAFEHLRKTCPGTIALRDMERGFRMAEPLLVIADQCIRYAKAYRAEFEQTIGEDYVCRPEFSSLLSGFRGLLNFDGAAKWEACHNSSVRIGTDTKDNGMIESLYWTACEIAGIDGNDI
jgi:hypothetical protein